MWALHIFLVWILHRILLFRYLCCRVTKEGAELLHWEQDLLGLELVESQFPGAGVGVATTATSQFKKGELIAQYIGRFLVYQNQKQICCFTQCFLKTMKDLLS